MAAPPRGSGFTLDDNECAICQTLLPVVTDSVNGAARTPPSAQERLRDLVLCPPPRRTALPCGHAYHRHCGQWLAAAGVVTQCVRCAPRQPGTARRQHGAALGGGKAAGEARAEVQLTFDDAARRYVKAAAWVAADAPREHDENSSALRNDHLAPTVGQAAAGAEAGGAASGWAALPAALAVELADAVAALRKLTGEHSGAGGGGTKALEHGHPQAQVLLARLWQRAEGVPRVDLRRSLRLLQVRKTEDKKEEKCTPISHFFCTAAWHIFFKAALGAPAFFTGWRVRGVRPHRPRRRKSTPKGSLGWASSCPSGPAATPKAPWRFRTPPPRPRCSPRRRHRATPERRTSWATATRLVV